jgi:hypothetical protein
MAAACLASLAILAGGLSLVYGLGWYRDRKQNGKTSRDVKVKEKRPEQSIIN